VPEPGPQLEGIDGAWSPAAPAVTVTRPRSLAGGVELSVDGPGGSFAFLNTLGGYIRVGRRSAGAIEPVELISVARRGGSFRPIRKRVAAGGDPAARSIRRRTPFAFTSVAELAREYVESAKSIQKIDTPPPVS
jgi:hypothetical protein